MAGESETDSGSDGNLPGTAHLGMVLTERVNVERKISGVWTVVSRSVAATFENVMPTTRKELEAWTHKPLYMLWLSPVTTFADGDRVIRGDGTRWYMRGAPMTAPLGTHVVALVEGSAEDGLFAARTASEPS